ncbi:hypothetical protein [Streptomyces sp. NBC_00503]|uniref:hypothetical protein n=1 Tax=Streptomyces sp. NBC_00503 TaxID=2903659 RepID=UPI002E8005C4|nr:hypothetical protein [Streptomyces sp. NBC_00503]WUD85392.1 hypothetical protein OG490_35195 [Streptomyces sp. NBC_00503]
MSVLTVLASLDGTETWLVVVAVAAVVLCELARRWFCLRTVECREAEHTRRVMAAVGGTQSGHRAEVVQACAVLGPGGGARTRARSRPTPRQML